MLYLHLITDKKFSFGLAYTMKNVFLSVCEYKKTFPLTRGPQNVGGSGSLPGQYRVNMPNN